MKATGRPIIGGIGGMFFGLFGALDLQQFGVRPVDTLTLFGFPVVGLIAGGLLGWSGPIRRRQLVRSRALWTVGGSFLAIGALALAWAVGSGIAAGVRAASPTPLHIAPPPPTKTCLYRDPVDVSAGIDIRSVEIARKGNVLTMNLKTHRPMIGFSRHVLWLLNSKPILDPIGSGHTWGLEAILRSKKLAAFHYSPTGHEKTMVKATGNLSSEAAHITLEYPGVGKQFWWRLDTRTGFTPDALPSWDVKPLRFPSGSCRTSRR